MDMNFRMTRFGMENENTRENWIRDVLTQIPAGLKILDAGAGDQHHKELCSHLEYISQDSAEYDGKGNTQGLQTGAYDYGKLDIISDIISIPRDDKSFDAVLCTEVLEHIINPEEAIKELSRLIKPKGRLILTAPFASLTHFAPQHFMTGFNIYWYNNILPKYGLKIIFAAAYGDYFEYLAQELNRIYTVANTYCPAAAVTNEGELTALEIITRMLMRFNINSNGASSELLCYGFLIIGEKEN